jgi:hypothetical protein
MPSSGHAEVQLRLPLDGGAAAQILEQVQDAGHALQLGGGELPRGPALRDLLVERVLHPHDGAGDAAEHGPIRL